MARKLTKTDYQGAAFCAVFAAVLYGGLGLVMTHLRYMLPVWAWLLIMAGGSAQAWFMSVDLAKRRPS